MFTLLIGGIAAAIVTALINKYHTVNSYHASLIGYVVSGFSPIGILVGYISTLLLNSSRLNILPAALVTLISSTILFPIFPLPTIPLGGLLLIVLSFPCLVLVQERVGNSIRKEVTLMPSNDMLRETFSIIGRVLLLVLLLGVSPLLNTTNGVVVIIFAFSALSINVSESETNGLSLGLSVEKQKEKESLIKKNLSALEERSELIVAIASLVLSLLTMGVGAGSAARRWGCNTKTCFLLETAIEGMNLKALLTLGAVIPARTSLADILLDTKFGWMDIAGMSALPISISWVIVILVISIVVFLLVTSLLGVAKANNTSGNRERVLAMLSVVVLCGFNPITAGLALGIAYIAKRFLPNEVSYTMPLIGAMGYQAR